MMPPCFVERDRETGWLVGFLTLIVLWLSVSLPRDALC